MKKWVLRIVISVVALFVVAVVAVVIFLDAIVKKGVETVGPRITKVDVKLAGAHLSIFSGSADLKGLFVGNPSGYTTESAINVGEVNVSMKPMSVLSDKIIIDSVDVKAPEITLEGGLRDNNLSRIQSNISGASRSSSSGGASPAGGSGKKIQVGDLVISGATLRVKSSLIGGKMLSVALPDVHLTHLGTGSDGLTPAELTDKVMNALMNEVIPAFAKLVSNAGLDAVKYGKGAEKLGQDGLNKASGGLKKLFGN